MFRGRVRNTISSAILLLTAGGFAAVDCQATGAQIILDTIDESRLVTLAGNTRPEANSENDRGAVPDDFPLNHMLLQLKRSPQQDLAVDRLIAELHDPHSTNFHKWLTPVEFGKRFGLAEADLRIVTSWFESHGFTINLIYPSQMVIDLSGTAGAVREALHTSIHNLNVDGEPHVANMGDPQIPAALAPAVAGIVSLHDFRPRSQIARSIPASQSMASKPNYTGAPEGQTIYLVAPGDLATIYDFNPLLAKGITGQGQTIAVVEDSNLHKASDWTTFVKAFGLAQYSGTLSTTAPAPATGMNNCFSPGVNGDSIEATLDAEWAAAAAPGATVEVAACADLGAAGVYIAELNLVNGSTPPQIISISYSICESEAGIENTQTSHVYQQAVAEGISVFAAAGDAGAAECDSRRHSATRGINVSGGASTPYNVAVGGTDFGDVYAYNTGAYWNTTSASTWGSALSYIPEIPWNSSCASSLIAGFLGFANGWGPGGWCAHIADTETANYFDAVVAGGGGPSSCATGVPAIPGIVGGSCAGYPKPSWQTGVTGIPNDGVRDLPDVSMFASNGVWGHTAIMCYTDVLYGGLPCTGDPGYWVTAGGTSLATPIMAGVQALVNQNAGGAQGNPAVVYYQLAATTPGVFHPITQGDIEVNCSGAINCYGYLGNIDYGRNGRLYDTTFGGGLSVSNSAFEPAYAAGTSWNFANGLGSVDVNMLVTNWPK